MDVSLLMIHFNYELNLFLEIKFEDKTNKRAQLSESSKILS